MSEVTATPAAPAPERPDTIGVRFVRACLLAFLGALFLTLRVRLPAGYRRLLARGDDLPPGFLAAFAPDAPAHAACIALGLVGDWILRGFPNRGSRATPARRPHLPPPNARAPPSSARLRLLRVSRLPTEAAHPHTIYSVFELLR
jgi:hypothetical protein